MKACMKVVLLCLAASAVCFGASEPSRVDARVSEMAWIAGHWVDESGGDLSEETWGPPSGDCLVGMWRLVIDGKAKLYELLTITAEPEGVVLRLRHFDRSGVGWEDKEHPLVLKLVQSKQNEAVFEGQDAKGFLRISYRRVDAGTLMSVVERGTTEKEVQREEFRFRRKSL